MADSWYTRTSNEAGTSDTFQNAIGGLMGPSGDNWFDVLYEKYQAIAWHKWLGSTPNFGWAYFQYIVNYVAIFDLEPLTSTFKLNALTSVFNIPQIIFEYTVPEITDTFDLRDALVSLYTIPYLRENTISGDFTDEVHLQKDKAGKVNIDY